MLDFTTASFGETLLSKLSDMANIVLVYKNKLLIKEIYSKD